MGKTSRKEPLAILALAAILVAGAALWCSGAAGRLIAFYEFRWHEALYQEAGEAIISAEASAVANGSAAFYTLPSLWTALSCGSSAVYFEVDGRSYVYFATRDGTTLGSGLFFCPDGKLPSGPASGASWIASQWAYGMFENGYMESQLQ